MTHLSLAGKVPLDYIESDPEELHRGLTALLAPDDNNARQKLKARIESRIEAISTQAITSAAQPVPPAASPFSLVAHRGGVLASNSTFNLPSSHFAALNLAAGDAADAGRGCVSTFPAELQQGQVILRIGNRVFEMHRRVIMRECRGRLASMLLSWSPCISSPLSPAVPRSQPLSSSSVELLDQHCRAAQSALTLDTAFATRTLVAHAVPPSGMGWSCRAVSRRAAGYGPLHQALPRWAGSGGQRAVPGMLTHSAQIPKP